MRCRFSSPTSQGQNQNRNCYSDRACNQFVLPDSSARNRLAQQQRKCFMQKLDPERQSGNCKQAGEKSKGYNAGDELCEISPFEETKDNEKIRPWQDERNDQRRSRRK